MNTNTRSRRRNRILEVLDSISYQLAHQVLLLLEEIEIVIAVLVVGYLTSYVEVEDIEVTTRNSYAKIAKIKSLMTLSTLFNLSLSFLIIFIKYTWS